MWPYRPWLLKAQQQQQQLQQQQEQEQQRQRQQSQGGAFDNAGNVPVSMSMNTPASSMSGSVHSHLLPRPPGQGHPQATLRDWTRRYQPVINSRVYGYPSTGGVLILPGYDINLPYLGLQRFTEAKRSNNTFEEDLFCRRLRWLGASWWPYPDADLDALSGSASREEMERAAVHVIVGWLPNGAGVWVLKYNENDPDDNDLGLKAQRAGSMDMPDRCRMIEELGGKFFKHPDECEDLRWGTWLPQGQE